MEIYKQEIFGPVLSTVRTKSYDEALKLVMDNEYGNGTAIYTADGDTARDFASRVNVGMVGINFPIPVPLSYFSFGGWKRSAFGDLNQYGPDAFVRYSPPAIGLGFWAALPDFRARVLDNLRIVRGREPDDAVAGRLEALRDVVTSGKVFANFASCLADTFLVASGRGYVATVRSAPGCERIALIRAAVPRSPITRTPAAPVRSYDTMRLVFRL